MSGRDWAGEADWAGGGETFGLATGAGGFVATTRLEVGAAADWLLDTDVLAGAGGALADVVGPAGFELALWVGDDAGADLVSGATASAADPTACVTGCTTELAACVTALSGAPPDAGLDPVEPSANSSAATTPVAGGPAKPVNAATAIANTIKHQRPGRQRQLIRGLRVQPHARSDVREPNSKRLDPNKR